MKIFTGYALLAVFILSGCSGTESVQSDEYLVRIDVNVVTVLDFQRAFETAKSAYPHNITNESSVYREVKQQLLNQMIEELIVVQRAKELNITVTDQELGDAVEKIKKDYPEDEFEQTLLEYAISYKLWEKELRTRLIMEKVITEDLKNNIVVTPDDMAKYYSEHLKNGSGDSSNKPATEIAVKNLRNAKAESAYKTWINELQRKYKIEINKKQWEKMIS
ncbi:MAG: SurA N-terminal domain-containing protein [Desulfobacterales bacterium]|nr:SurA N-terminal domain-containing protein [Desulfobacterales bacterium]